MNKTLKIGFVCDDTLDKPDGVQQYILSLGRWLNKNNHEVHYLVGQSVRDDISNVHSLSRNIKVSFNKNRLSIPLPSNSAKIKQLLDKERFDVLHVQMPYSPMLAARVIAAAPPTTAVIGTFHILPHSNFEKKATGGLRLLLRTSLKRFDKIISVSPAARDFAADAFKTDSIVIPNAIDVKYFKQAGTSKNKVDGKTTIVFLGRLVKRKGPLYLVKALHRLTDQVPKENLRILICGKGPDDYKVANAAKRAQLLSTDGQHGLHMLGFISEEEKVRLLAEADIAVFPSTGGESFGIVLVEAMAAGAGVVIGGNNAGYASVLGPCAHALFNPKDTAAFSRTLQLFIEDKALRQRTHEIQQSIVDQYDVDEVGPQIVKVYRQAIAKIHQNKHNGVYV